MSDRDSAAIRRGGYTWNTVASVLMAAQSVVMLMVITRTTSLEMAGIFTLAFASANLFLNMGRYGMRNYQASDAAPRFSFRDYARSRVITSVAMMVCAVVYLVWSTVTLGYSAEKSAIILWVCLFKLVDVVEDVFHGDFQQHLRLDVAGMLLSLRLTVTLVLFGCVMAFCRDLLLSLVISTLFTAVFMVGELLFAHRRYHLPQAGSQSSWHAVGLLLRDCFPLFLAAFLLFYIGNAPKYAIDACMDDTAQAYFGFISMPVFVINLFASFIYSPAVAPLSKMWAAEDREGFGRLFRKQVLSTLVIGVVCVIGCALIGIPVLNLVFATDVSPYYTDMLVLMVGGTGYALAILFTIGITVLRCQRRIAIGYVVVSVACLFGATWAVQAAGILGAAWTYCVSMIALAIWFGVLFAAHLRNEEV